MQKLQLYIEGQRVDLFKDENVSFTQTLQNVKDIGKIFTEFTKTFAVPASSVNNKIFKHFYNFDVSSGDTTFAYDARNKQPATLELNDLPFKEGAIKLNGVKLKNNVAHTYNITFFGNTVNLKDILAKSQLSSLSGLAQHNQIYSYSDVVSAMQATQSSGDIIVPLITHTNRLIYNSGSNVVFPPDPDLKIRNLYPHTSSTHNGVEWNQFKYAIKVQAIIDAIQAEVFVGGQTLTFSGDFFNNATNDDFNNLYLWLHRKKGSVDAPSQVLQNFTQVTELGTTVCVPSSNCQPSTSNVSNGILALTAQSPYSISFLNLNVTPPNNTDAYIIRVIRDGSQIVSEVTGTGAKQLIVVPFNDSTYTVQIASSTNMLFAIGNIQWTVSWTTGTIGGFGTNGQMIYSNASAFQTTAFIDFNINEQMPKMAIIDFLTGLFKLFNLTAYVDNLGVIVVRTLDSYYAAGSAEPINIDRYLDTTTSTVNVALPFKNIDFQYKGLGTLLAKQFEQINNLGWGTLSYSLDGNIYDAPTKKYKIELPFEHMQYERLYDVQGGASTTAQYGFFVDDNLEPYFGMPLLFYPIRQINETAIRIIDTDYINLVQNGDFSNGSNNWTIGNGWVVGDNKASCNGTQSSLTNLQQTISSNIQNDLVSVTFTLDYTAGILNVSLSGTGSTDFSNITSSGIYTADITSNQANPTLTFEGDSSFNGVITSVIIKSVTSVSDIDDYFIPSNAVALESSTSKSNIHFGNEINEYQANEVGDPLSFTDTLFETNYKTYIQNVFNVSRRITKVTAYLPMKIYYNLQLNDLIQLGQNNYKINSLTTNLTTGKTEFELLNDVKQADLIVSVPTTPTNLVASNNSSSGFTITWDASTSPNGTTMSYYVLLLNGVAVGGALAYPLASTYSDDVTGLNPQTGYPVTVIAYDINGNQSLASNILQAFTT